MHLIYMPLCPRFKARQFPEGVFWRGQGSGSMAQTKTTARKNDPECVFFCPGGSLEVARPGDVLAQACIFVD
jgi:hypothetical protein